MGYSKSRKQNESPRLGLADGYGPIWLARLEGKYKFGKQNGGLSTAPLACETCGRVQVLPPERESSRDLETAPIGLEVIDKNRSMWLAGLRGRLWGLLGNRQGEFHGATFSFLGLDPDPTPVNLEDTSRQRQPCPDPRG